MKKLSIEKYNELTKNSEMLTNDLYGDKVLKLKDGRIVKLFRLKRFLSSALIWPYAKRFVRGVKILEKFNIPTVKSVELYKVPSIKRDIVIYQPLEGESLRDLIKKTKDPSELIFSFARFFASLHNKGIYFRAIHFNNVFVTPKCEFGLIDVSDLYYSFLPMTISKRVRNFKPFFHYKEDRQAIESFSLEKFLNIYLEYSNLKSKKSKTKFKKKVSKLFTQTRK